ncbi:MAG: hypothetical protein WC858_06275 [Parcubacteria group bacterium]|jgi:hypothetical protein
MERQEFIKSVENQPETASSDYFYSLFDSRLEQAPLLDKEKGVAIAHTYRGLGISFVRKRIPALIIDCETANRIEYNVWLQDPTVPYRENAPHNAARTEFEHVEKKSPNHNFYPKSSTIIVGEKEINGSRVEVRILIVEESFFNSAKTQLSSGIDDDSAIIMKDLVEKYNINAIVGKPKDNIEIHPTFLELSKNIPVIENPENAEERRKNIVFKKIAKQYNLTAIEYMKFLALCRAEKESGHPKMRTYCDLAEQIVGQREEIPQAKIFKRTYQFRLPEPELHTDSLNENAQNCRVEAIVTPPDPGTGEKEKSNVLFIPGMIAKEEMLSNTLLALSRKGHKAFAPIHAENKMLSRKHESLALIERQKAFASLSILDQENIKDGVVVAASLGGVSGLYTAYLDSRRAPEDRRIKKIILINPAGIVERSLLGLIFSSGKDVAKEKAELAETAPRRKDMDTYQETVRQKIKGHPLRTSQELLATAKTDVQYLLKRLIEAGTEISIICSKDDTLFSAEKIRKRLKELGITNINVVEAEGTHYNFLTHPSETMRLVDEEISG